MVLLRFAEMSTGMSVKPKDKPEITTSFTVDSEESDGGSMPGVTKLLNRRSFVKTKGSDKEKNNVQQPKVQEPPAPAGEIELAPAAQEKSVHLETFSAPEAVASVPQLPLGIQRSTRVRVPNKPLVVWTNQDLKGGTDPLGKGILALLQGGVTHCLFLAIQEVPEKSLPVFNASAAVNAGSSSTVWEGLRWDPEILPEVWTMLVSAAFAEFPPPGTLTNMASTRNLSRSAFDVAPESWLTIVRVGTQKQCRGILALISKASIADVIRKTMPILSQVPQTNDQTSEKKSA
jgi:hypothetical protein